jgi:hypothetical protein
MKVKQKYFIYANVYITYHMGNTISQYHKIILIYVGIIILTSIIFIYFKHKEEEERRREGNFFDDISNTINDIKNFVNDITRFFRSIPGRVSNFSKAFDKVGKGLKTSWLNLGLSLNEAGDNVGAFFPLIGKYFNNYLASRLKCSFEKMGKFKPCFKYYLLELIGEILYSIIVRLPAFILHLITGIDVNSQIDIVWNVIYWVDDIIYDLINYHIAHWSDEILNECYLCEGLYPLPNFEYQINKIHADFKSMEPDNQTRDPKSRYYDPNHRTIPNLMSEPGQHFTDAANSFKKVFT